MLKELRSQHRNIIQMAFNGYKNSEIAERLGMAQTTVSTILRSPLGQAYLNGLQDRATEATLDVRKKLVSLNKSALATFEHLLDKSSRKNVPASVQFNAAKDVLDRNGYKAPDRLNIDMTLQTKTDEELDAEIAAIEASIGKATGIKNLPEIKRTSSNVPIETSFNNSFSPQPELSVPSAQCSPEPEPFEPIDLEDQLSLEDFNWPELPEIEVDEHSFIEDPDLLNFLPLDIFKER